MGRGTSWRGVGDVCFIGGWRLILRWFLEKREGCFYKRQRTILYFKHPILIIKCKEIE
jgi:hypothetical protein